MHIFHMRSHQQAILHMVPPQTPLTQPPKTSLSPHSHTPTHPAFPPIPFPIPTTQLQHLFPTQTLSQTNPKNLKID
ncbi:aconitase family protein, partial [Staphylococcus cohnii]|uniref:aconitase family protein n=1 Tax=Staphylococcus cohnii TaxID=29382 RepID=UPI0034DAFF4E